MDVLGQTGDPDVPNKLLEMQYASGRYYTLIYSASGALQRERGYATLAEATRAFEDMRIAVIDGSLDPSQPVFPPGPGRLRQKIVFKRLQAARLYLPGFRSLIITLSTCPASRASRSETVSVSTTLRVNWQRPERRQGRSPIGPLISGSCLQRKWASSAAAALVCRQLQGLTAITRRVLRRSRFPSAMRGWPGKCLM